MSTVMQSKQRWQDAMALVLGAWLVLAPFVLGFYPSLAAAAWNAVIVGLLIAGDAVWALAARQSGGTPVHHS